MRTLVGRAFTFTWSPWQQRAVSERLGPTAAFTAMSKALALLEGGEGLIGNSDSAALRLEGNWLHWICISRAYQEMEWKMQRRQPEELLGRWELPNSFSGVSAAVSQLLDSGLYFQGYCLIKEETSPLKGYLIPPTKLLSLKSQAS